MEPKRIIIHCSASKHGTTAQEIEDWHKKRGFRKIGYHAVILSNGETVKYPFCRALNEQGAHTKGHNDSIGVCLVGNGKYYFRQFLALSYFIQSIQYSYDIPNWEIYGHYEFDPNKTCPIINMKRLLCWIQGGELNCIKPYLIPVGSG